MGMGLGLGLGDLVYLALPGLLRNLTSAGRSRVNLRCGGVPSGHVS